MHSGKKLSSLGRAAVKYARDGWHVFPLQPRAKEPVTSNGFRDATNDLRQVRAWWREHPDANIGAVPGTSGYVVLDLDSPRALRTAKRLGARRNQTRVSVTGRDGGGWHLYFKRPDFSVGNKKLAEQIDVRGDKGYVILPPSIHPTGTRYRWKNPDQDITPLPPKVLAQLRQTRNGKSNPASPLPTVIREGDRNSVLASLAGSMRRRGATPEAILEALRVENETRCDPPLSERELGTIAASVGRYPPANRNGAERAGKMRVAKLSSVEMQPVSWLWRGYLPLGKLVMLDGYPGQGKSAAVLDIAARGSRGRKMPDGSRGDVEGPWDTLILTYEDDAADTLRPRIEAARGEPKRIRYVKGIAYDGEADLVAPTLPQDLAALDRVLARWPDIRLLVIDPLMASLSGKIDAHRDQDTWRVTARLARIASERNVCIVGIRHFRKHTDGNAITAGGGSIGFIGQARVGLVIDRHPDTEDAEWADVSVLACAKSNLGAPAPSLAFSKTSVSVSTRQGLMDTLRLKWTRDVQLSADELLARREEGGTGNQYAAVETWLREVLSDGQVERKAVMKAARAEGFPVRTVDYIAQRIGVIKMRQGAGPQTRSLWSLIADKKPRLSSKH